MFLLASSPHVSFWKKFPLQAMQRWSVESLALDAENERVASPHALLRQPRSLYRRYLSIADPRDCRGFEMVGNRAERWLRLLFSPVSLIFTVLHFPDSWLHSFQELDYSSHTRVYHTRTLAHSTQSLTCHFAEIPCFFFSLLEVQVLQQYYPDRRTPK